MKHLEWAEQAIDTRDWDDVGVFEADSGEYVAQVPDANVARELVQIVNQHDHLLSLLLCQVEQAALIVEAAIAIWGADLDKRKATNEVTPFTFPVMNEGLALREALAALDAYRKARRSHETDL